MKFTQVKDIYNFYLTPLNLQKHQLLTANLIASLLKKHPNVISRHKDLLKAALLHDMGNIVKFNINDDNYKNKEKEVALQELQNIYKNRYVAKSLECTLMILKELDVSKKIIKIINFDPLIHNFTSQYRAGEILALADLHVELNGYCSIEEKITYVLTRYKTSVLLEGKNKEKYLNTVKYLNTKYSFLFKQVAPIKDIVLADDMRDSLLALTLKTNINKVQKL